MKLPMMVLGQVFSSCLYFTLQTFYTEFTLTV